MKILWSSPLPPIRSGISDYAVELLEELRHLAEIRLVAPPGWLQPANWHVNDAIPVVPSDARALADEINLVHLGNNPHHVWLLDRLELPRTIAVLHDVVLHHLLVEGTLARGDADGYGRLLAAGAGFAAGPLERARRVGVTGRRDPFMFPARRGLLARVSGVIVHSLWAAREVASDLPGVRVAPVGLAVEDPGPVDRQEVRRRLGMRPDTIVLMHLGFLTPEKGLLAILTAMAAARRAGFPVHLVVGGEGSEASHLRSVADSVGLAPLVTFTGWLPEQEMRWAPAAADLGVVHREPSAGETSAAAVRFFACGTPVAVTGLNQFLEWPERAAPRITPGQSSAADLARLLLEAASDRRAWEPRRTAAREAYEAGHRPSDVARQMVEALATLVD